VMKFLLEEEVYLITMEVNNMAVFKNFMCNSCYHYNNKEYTCCIVY